MTRYIAVFYNKEKHHESPQSEQVYEFSTLIEIKYYLLHNEDDLDCVDVYDYENNELLKTFEVCVIKKIYEIHEVYKGEKE